MCSVEKEVPKRCSLLERARVPGPCTLQASLHHLAQSPSEESPVSDILQFTCALLENRAASIMKRFLAQGFTGTLNAQLRFHEESYARGSYD